MHPKRHRLATCPLLAFACGAALAACHGELRPVVAAPATDAAPADAPIPADAPRGSPEAASDAACMPQRILPLPLDLFFLIDGYAAIGNWSSVSAGLSAFLHDPSTNVGVGLQTMGLPARCERDGDCYAGETCQPKSVCQAPDAVETTPDAVPCGKGFPACPRLSVCRPLGRCSLTMRSCTNIGGACPGRLLDNVCLPIPQACFANGEAAPSCEAADYRQALVPIARLPGVDRVLGYALEAQELEEPSLAPLGPALAGSLDYLRSELAQPPDHRVALVLISNGDVDACAPRDIGEIAGLAARAHAQSPPIDTYVIGVLDAAGARLYGPRIDRLAADGGTGNAYVIDRDDLTEGIHAVLNDILVRATPCEFAIDSATDPVASGVRTVGDSGQYVRYVDGVAGCDPVLGGWYYQPPIGLPARNKRLVLCEATCTEIKRSPAPAIELPLRCVGEDPSGPDAALLPAIIDGVVR